MSDRCRSCASSTAASRFAVASGIAGEVTQRSDSGRVGRQLAVDRLVTSPWLGLPIMVALLGGVLWLTIAGANVPSAMLASLLIDEGGLGGWLQESAGWQQPWSILSLSLYEILHQVMAAVEAPWWLSGFLVDGVYLGLAWVVSVMLPPMAIFFPLFTVLEDLGLLPRLAFNMDRLFRAAGGHGKQALTMAMGFGCNAAGVIACRIIDSPRERMLAIVTNTFVPCNGRWPTLIMMASLFLAASVPATQATLLAVGAVTATAVLGVIVTLLVSWALSRTLLKGAATGFAMELPPYRPPQFGRILSTSFIDRTLFVLWRAGIFAAPAGGLIWLLGAIPVGGGPVRLARRCARPAGGPARSGRRAGDRLSVRHPGQRDRHPDRDHGLSPGRPHGRDRGSLDPVSGQRLDPGHGGVRDAVLAASLPVHHDHPDHLGRDPEREVDGAGQCHSAGAGRGRVCRRPGGRRRMWFTIATAAATPRWDG